MFSLVLFHILYYLVMYMQLFVITTFSY